MTITQPIHLYGKRVRLEPLALQHASDLHAAAQHDEIWRYMPYPRPARVEDTESWISTALTHAEHGQAVPFAIIDPVRGRAIGSTRFMDILASDRGLEIGWTWLARDYWRTAMNTECKFLLFQHAFETIGAIRVQLKTDLRNVRSQNAIERLGAVREGVLREHRIVHDGYRRSSVYYSVLEAEWPAVKSRLTSLLTQSSARTDEPSGS